MLFLDDGTAQAAFVSDDAPIRSVTTTTSYNQPLDLGLGDFADFGSINGANSDLWIQGTSDSGVTPSFVLPDSNVGNNKNIGTGNNGTPDPDNYNAATDVYFKFGDINNPDRDADSEYVIVEFNALVANDLTDDSGNVDDNNSGDTRTNRFEVNVGTGINFNTQNELVVSNAIYNRIVEPNITLRKEVGADSNSLSTNNFLADSGNTVYFALDFDNIGNINTQSTAFEVTVTDQVPDGLTLLGIESIDWDNGDGSGGSGQSTGISSGTPIDVGDMVITPTFNTGTGNITVDVDKMPTDGDITVIYTATVDGEVNPDKLLTNTANVIYSSLPGTGSNITDTADPNYTGSTTDDPNSTVGDSGTTTGERNHDSDTTSNSANDYSDTASANVQINPLEPVKSLVETSEAHTTDNNDVAIGEIVRYRLAVAIPEGVTNNFQITDDLPPGLLYLGQPKLAFVADRSTNGIDSSTISGTGLDITGTAATTPTFDLTTGVTSADGGDSTFTSGENVIFSLGNLTNNDRDDDNQEFVIIEFNALVENISTNVAATGVLPNDFIVSGSGVTARESNSVTLDIVEPVITSVQKTADIDNADATDTATYTITFANTGADAFDLNIADTLPSGLDNLSITSTKVLNASDVDVTTSESFSFTTTGSTSSSDGTSTDSPNADILDIDLDRLPTNYSVEIVYTATVVNDITIGSTVTNTVDVTYTSLPGDGTTFNGTGSTTPGTSGAANGDRNGSGTSHNTYAVSNSDSIIINSYSIGSTVFADTNKNGFQDTGASPESGISGVTVQLFNDVDSEILVGADGILGTMDDGTGGMLTDESGNYFFTALPPGNYSTTQKR